MRAISLFNLVITMPLVFAIGFAVHASIRKSQRERSIMSFSYCVAHDSPASVTSLLKTSGLAATRELIAATADADPRVVFDGDARYAQILKGHQDYGPGVADGYAVCSLDHPSDGLYVVSGPPGTKINAISFHGDLLLIELCGTLRLGSVQCEIPEELPEMYAVPWPKDSSVPIGHHIWNMIASRHAADLHRTR